MKKSLVSQVDFSPILTLIQKSWEKEINDVNSIFYKNKRIENELKKLFPKSRNLEINCALYIKHSALNDKRIPKLHFTELAVYNNVSKQAISKTMIRLCNKLNISMLEFPSKVLNPSHNKKRHRSIIILPPGMREEMYNIYKKKINLGDPKNVKYILDKYIQDGSVDNLQEFVDNLQEFVVNLQPCISNKNNKLQGPNVLYKYNILIYIFPYKINLIRKVALLSPAKEITCDKSLFVPLKTKRQTLLVQQNTSNENINKKPEKFVLKVLVPKEKIFASKEKVFAPKTIRYTLKQKERFGPMNDIDPKSKLIDPKITVNAAPPPDQNKKIKTKKLIRYDLKVKPKDVTYKDYDVYPSAFKPRSHVPVYNVLTNMLEENIMNNIYPKLEETSKFIKSWNILDDKRFRKYGDRQDTLTFREVVIAVSNKIGNGISIDTMINSLQNYFNFATFHPQLKYRKKFDIINYICGDKWFNTCILNGPDAMKDGYNFEYKLTLDKILKTFTRLFHDGDSKSANYDIKSNYYRFMKLTEELVNDHKNKNMCGMSMQKYINTYFEFIYDDVKEWKKFNMNYVLGDKVKGMFIRAMRADPATCSFYFENTKKISEE